MRSEKSQGLAVPSTQARFLLGQTLEIVQAKACSAHRNDVLVSQGSMQRAACQGFISK